MKHCSIISFIENNANELLKHINKNSYIICADCGYLYARESGITPDLIIGDFDSYTGSLPDNIPIIRLPVEKDNTDTDICISHAIENGFTDITIYGGLGGRLDHTIANLQLIADAAERGINISLIGDNFEIFAVSDSSISLSKRENCYLSVFSLSDISEGVSETGTKYSIDNATLTRTFPLGVSNEFADDTAVITVKKGTLLIIICHENHS